MDKENSDNKKLMQFVYKTSPIDIYKKWYQEFLLTLSQKEVTQLRQDMPAYLLIDD